MSGSFVVTGGGRGVGRAVVSRLLADGGRVVVIERDSSAVSWLRHESADADAVVGDAADPAVASRAADLAGDLTGWVNNAAVFRDAAIHSAPPSEISELIRLNLDLALVGCATAVRRFLASGVPGAIVNVSSHQAQRPVAGALPYATAKAAIEGLTRALAVDYGPRGIRTNAVSLGSIATERYDAYAAASDTGAVEAAMAELHPLGRVGQPSEIAATIAFLLSPEAGFVNGAVLPVDGGRSAKGPDPESHPPVCLGRPRPVEFETGIGQLARVASLCTVADWQCILDHCAVPDGTPVNHLATELVARMRHPDPAIRDGASYTVLARWIDRGVLDDHLDWIGDQVVPWFGDLAIQARTFAPLVLDMVMTRRCLVADLGGCLLAVVSGRDQPPWLRPRARLAARRGARC